MYIYTNIRGKYIHTIYIYTHTHILVYEYTCFHINANTCIHVHPTHIYVYICVGMCICTDAVSHKHSGVFIMCKHTYIQIICVTHESPCRV